MVGYVGIRKEVPKSRNGIFKHLAALSERDAKGLEVALSRSLAYADDQVAFAQDIDGGEGLCDGHGVAEWQPNHARSKVHVEGGCTLSDSPQEDEAIHPWVEPDDVVSHPDVREA